MTPGLQIHADRLASVALSDLAAANAGLPFVEAAGWRVDLSRHRLDGAALEALNGFAEARALGTALEALFGAAHVNPSEDRPALHWALRAQAPLDGAEAESVRQSLSAADAFAAQVYSGAPLSSTGAAFTSLVHIGIGGSDFGPRLIADSLTGIDGTKIDLRFCANLDPHDLDSALAGLDPATTLVVGVSKSFGTEETLYNLSRARDWLKATLGEGWTKHMALVTANPERATTWLEGGDAHIFDLPLSVGGRFSLWSAASLSCACVLGLEPLQAFRAGAAAMDEHVRTTPLATNLAVQLALLDYWNTSILGHSQRVVLGYARRLRMLPTYLQQLEMESNGKSVSPEGVAIDGPTAPALWGGEGSIGQHSYHQWLHQGTQIVPTEFILPLTRDGDVEGRKALAAHALAQAEVLANGRSLETVKTEEPGLSETVAAQKVHGGERPSTFMLHEDFGPHALGALIALYEHRTYLAGVLWGVNSFDQWGVERGKTMAGRLKPVLSGEGSAEDPVTAKLAALVKAAL
ncbi:MAG: glucose-6-phosphate isomerase [Hyphomonadaceae bacterium]|nr:glucose-6-phosphate isomerase [Hyphomonadaceae bacterium]